MTVDAIAEKRWKNTFAPACKNKELTLSQIMSALKAGLLNFESLPPHMQEEIHAEMKRRDL